MHKPEGVNKVNDGTILLKKILCASLLCLAGTYGALADNIRVVTKINNNQNFFIEHRAIEGAFTVKATVGYFYNPANSWIGDFSDEGRQITGVEGLANSTVGYGASFGYTHLSGLGLSADYIGFNSRWTTADVPFAVSYHVLSLTPSYRFALGKKSDWALRLGLGIGFSLSDITWEVIGATARANNASLSTVDVGNNPSGRQSFQRHGVNRTSARAKDDAGFVLTPQLSLEYDNGFFHGDINVRYLHALKDVRYNGVDFLTGNTYIVGSGPLGFFLGGAVGVNF